MSKHLQEESNVKLQVSFKKVLELIDNGNFFVESIGESAGGAPLDELVRGDLSARNKISVNLTIEVRKLPGMENHNSAVGNLVNSTVLDAGPYYNEAVDVALQDLKDASAVYEVLNKFIASKVDALMGELIEKNHALGVQSTVAELREVRAELVKELSNSAVREDMNRYLQVLIEKNLADAEFVSRLHASLNYEHFKNSIAAPDRLEFSQCINSFVGTRIDLIVQQKRDELIEDVKRAHPELLQSARFHDYIASRLIEQNERLKSTVLVRLGEQQEADIAKLKARLGEHLDDDERLNEIMNLFLVETVNAAVETVQANADPAAVRDDEALEGDRQLGADVMAEVNKYLGRLVLDNIQNSALRDVSTVMMLKSTLQSASKLGGS